MFNTLYKKNSTGKIVQCTYMMHEVEEDVFAFSAITGQVTGKKTQSKPKIAKPKNIGKANETSSYEQCHREICSKINKKRDEGYFDSIELAINSQVILPELATKFEDRKHNIDWTNAWASPKIDGLRSMMTSHDAKTRTGKEFKKVNHIIKDLIGLDDRFILDGELYTDKVPFEELVGLLRSDTLTFEEEELILMNVKLYVFDCIDLDDLNLDFVSRMELIEQNTPKTCFFEIVPQVKVTCEKELIELHDEWVELGYEGGMVRNGNAKYGLGKRTANIQKVKVFDDAEFEIIGHKEGEGNETGCVIWVCKARVGEFDCRPKGTREYKQDLFINAEKYYGSMLTVKYFGFTIHNKPRFPVGITIRNYE